MGIVESKGITSAITGESSPLPSVPYTPLRVIMCGASFETINGSMQDRPHTAEHLQAIMAPLGHMLRTIGDPGATCDGLTEAIVAHRSNVVNDDNESYYKVDAGVIGLSGEQPQDSFDPPYDTLAKISEQIAAFDYARKLYMIKPMSTVGADWCFIRQGGQFTDAKWQSYITAWEDYIATNHPEVSVIDAYLNLKDSKEYGTVFGIYGDWHITTTNCAVGARIIWDRISSELSPVDYTPPGFVPDTCPEIPR